MRRDLQRERRVPGPERKNVERCPERRAPAGPQSEDSLSSRTGDTETESLTNSRRANGRDIRGSERQCASPRKTEECGETSRAQYAKPRKEECGETSRAQCAKPRRGRMRRDLQSADRPAPKGECGEASRAQIARPQMEKKYPERNAPSPEGKSAERHIERRAPGP
jgi:hypothetical protein